jgi:hypothetical protein
MAGQLEMQAQGTDAYTPAAETLEQLGWRDNDRRLVVLRLDEQAWQVLQQAVLKAAARTKTFASTEDLLTVCLREWIEHTG